MRSARDDAKRAFCFSMKLAIASVYASMMRSEEGNKVRMTHKIAGTFCPNGFCFNISLKQCCFQRLSTISSNFSVCCPKWFHDRFKKRLSKITQRQIKHASRTIFGGCWCSPISSSSSSLSSSSSSKYVKNRYCSIYLNLNIAIYLYLSIFFYVYTCIYFYIYIYIYLLTKGEPPI